MCYRGYKNNKKMTKDIQKHQPPNFWPDKQQKKLSQNLILNYVVKLFLIFNSF